jgi:hypothetical protein
MHGNFPIHRQIPTHRHINIHRIPCLPVALDTYTCTMLAMGSMWDLWRHDWLWVATIIYGWYLASMHTSYHLWADLTGYG